MQEFIDGNRYFKVMGLFIVGFYIGRRKMYAYLASHKDLLRRVARFGFMVGLPLSAVYAWSATSGHPFDTVGHSVLYLTSVYPLGFAYMAGRACCSLGARMLAFGGGWRHRAGWR